jgi:hypothetical protein
MTHSTQRIAVRVSDMPPLGSKQLAAAWENSELDPKMFFGMAWHGMEQDRLTPLPKSRPNLSPNTCSAVPRTGISISKHCSNDSSNSLFVARQGKSHEISCSWWCHCEICSRTSQSTMGILYSRCVFFSRGGNMTLVPTLYLRKNIFDKQNKSLFHCP